MVNMLNGMHTPHATHATQLRRRLLDALVHAPLVLHPTSSLAHSKDVAWALSEALLAPSGPSPTTPSPPSPASTSPAPASEKGMGGGHSADAPPSAVAGAAGRQPISAVPLTAALHAMRVRVSEVCCSWQQPCMSCWCGGLRCFACCSSSARHVGADE